MTKITLLKEKLNKGFYVNNLNEIARLCNDMALENDKPAPFFVLKKIFSRISDYWDDQPVSVENAKLVQDGLMNPIMNLVNAIEVNASDNIIMDLVNKVVSSYLFFFQ